MHPIDNVPTTSGNADGTIGLVGCVDWARVGASGTISQMASVTASATMPAQW